MTTVKLAVYGTLKSEGNNHNILGPLAKVIARNIRIPSATLWDCGGMYPCVVRDLEGGGVSVDILEIPASVLRIVDEYEGVDKDPELSLFNREVVTLESGEEVLMYFFNRVPEANDFYKRIPSGRWEDV